MSSIRKSQLNIVHGRVRAAKMAAVLFFGKELPTRPVAAVLFE
jgi:hypothetical protein